MSPTVKSGLYGFLCILFYALSLWLFSSATQSTESQDKILGWIFSGATFLITFELYHQMRHQMTSNKPCVSVSTMTDSPPTITEMRDTIKIKKKDNNVDEINSNVIS